MPVASSSRFTICPCPTLQRAREKRMLISACIRKKKTRNRSSLVCIALAVRRGNRTSLYQAYPDIRKMIIKMRSIHAEMRFILTKILPNSKQFTSLYFAFPGYELMGCEKLIKEKVRLSSVVGK